MIRIPWQARLGLLLICCSGIVYSTKILLIDNISGTIEYLFNSFGFVFINVLVVTLVINELLSVRSKRERMEKMNMVIGVFFSEVGSGLLCRLISIDQAGEQLEKPLSFAIDSVPDFKKMEKKALSHSYSLDPSPADFHDLFDYLHSKNDFLLRLLENPVLLEHQSFTGLLQATFHLTEELSRRPVLTSLPDADCAHLAGDINRVYRQLRFEWIRYLEYLTRNYPYLYSLAVRTNPFDGSCSVIIGKKIEYQEDEAWVCGVYTRVPNSLSSI